MLITCDIQGAKRRRQDPQPILSDDDEEDVIQSPPTRDHEDDDEDEEDNEVAMEASTQRATRDIVEKNSRHTQNVICLNPVYAVRY